MTLRLYGGAASLPRGFSWELCDFSFFLRLLGSSWLDLKASARGCFGFYLLCCDLLREGVCPYSFPFVPTLRSDFILSNGFLREALQRSGVQLGSAGFSWWGREWGGGSPRPCR